MTTTTGPGLLKLPSLGSNSLHNQVSSSSSSFSNTNTSIRSTLPPTDRRRASITDPSLHAHSAMSLLTANPNGYPSSSSSSAHDQAAVVNGLRATYHHHNTLPSFRELPSRNRIDRNLHDTLLLTPSHSIDQKSSTDLTTHRRGSAADLDYILLNSNSPDHRHRHHPHPQPQQQQQQQSDQPEPSHLLHLQSSNSNSCMIPSNGNSNLSSNDLQNNHQQPLIHPVQPPKFNPPGFDSSATPSNTHLHHHQSNGPVSPRSFPSIPSTNHSEANILQLGPTVARRPSSAFRRRGSRVNGLDSCLPEDSSKKAMLSGPATTPTSAEHPSELSTASASKWPYPIPHHRHHLNKPSSPMKRRNSNQTISESNLVPQPTYFGLPYEKRHCQAGHPWNPQGGSIPNGPRQEILAEYTNTMNDSRLDFRRHSETSCASNSTSLCLDRRQADESAEREESEDPSHVAAGLHLRHRSRSSSSKYSAPAFSPSQTAVAASMNDYSFPSISYDQPVAGPPAYKVGPPENGMVIEKEAWQLRECSSFKDQVMARRGSGGEELHELKDRLAGTRLLDRLPPPSAPQDMAQINPANQALSANPYSRSPELKISHKLAERKRRKEMRDLFDELRDVLPAADQRHSKGSKWETLSRAVDYLQHIRLENERLKEENTCLHQKLNTIDPQAQNVKSADDDRHKLKDSSNGG